jgi:CHAT domain-containing protein
VLQALPRANLFHFAGHSIAGTGDARLLLAPEDSAQYDPSDLAVLAPTSLTPQILAACSLVVLSACSTDRLSDDALSDPRTVPAGLLGAGVPHVVASSWNVDSRATAALMHAFYDTLLATGSVTGSLRSAEILVSRQTATSHPYYWAAFKTWGEF